MIIKYQFCRSILIFIKVCMISEKDSKFEENTLLILKVHTTKVITKTILQFFATFSEKLNLHFYEKLMKLWMLIDSYKDLSLIFSFNCSKQRKMANKYLSVKSNLTTMKFDLISWKRYKKFNIQIFSWPNQCMTYWWYMFNFWRCKRGLGDQN